MQLRDRQLARNCRRCCHVVAHHWHDPEACILVALMQSRPDDPHASPLAVEPRETFAADVERLIQGSMTIVRRLFLVWVAAVAEQRRKIAAACTSSAEAPVVAQHGVAARNRKPSRLVLAGAIDDDGFFIKLFGRANREACEVGAGADDDADAALLLLLPPAHLLPPLLLYLFLVVVLCQKSFSSA